MNREVSPAAQEQHLHEVIAQYLLAVEEDRDCLRRPPIQPGLRRPFRGLTLRRRFRIAVVPGEFDRHPETANAVPA